MGKWKNAIKAGRGVQRDTFPTLLLPKGEPEDTTHDLLEEVSLQTGASPRAPFSVHPIEQIAPHMVSIIWGLMSMLDDPWQLNVDCVYVRVTLGEGGGDQPLPSHAWCGSLIANMFQDGLDEWTTKAPVLALGEAVLFFGRWSHKERLPYTSARDIGFSLTGQVNWAGRTAKIKVTAYMVQEGCWAIADAVTERNTKARSPWHPKGQEEPSGPWLVLVMWMIGCEIWLREHLMGMWEVLMTPAFDTLLDVPDGASNREHQGFLEVLPEAHPLWGMEVMLEEVIKALHTQQWWEHLVVVMDQCF